MLRRMSFPPAEVPPENVQQGLDEPHVEIMDGETRQVWQVMTPVSRADYDALAIEAPYKKIGIGVAVMDAAYFKRSPGTAEDGPMERREIAGLRWARCAAALEFSQPAGPAGPQQVSVDKHHVLHFEAGRRLTTLVLPDGSRYVHVICGYERLDLPEGWSIETERLAQARTLELPNPTTVFFFPSGDSYQGPV